MCLAIPGRIVSISDAAPLERCGNVDFGGVSKTINLAFVPEAGVGDYVLVHVGIAIARIAESEARRVFEYVAQLEGLAELGPS